MRTSCSFRFAGGFGARGRLDDLLAVRVQHHRWDMLSCSPSTLTLALTRLDWIHCRAPVRRPARDSRPPCLDLLDSCSSCAFDSTPHHAARIPSSTRHVPLPFVRRSSTFDSTPPHSAPPPADSGLHFAASRLQTRFARSSSGDDSALAILGSRARRGARAVDRMLRFLVIGVALG
jgi:hypothetical protein